MFLCAVKWRLRRTFGALWGVWQSWVEKEDVLVEHALLL